MYEAKITPFDGSEEEESEESETLSTSITLFTKKSDLQTTPYRFRGILYFIEDVHGNFRESISVSFPCGIPWINYSQCTSAFTTADHNCHNCPCPFEHFTHGLLEQLNSRERQLERQYLMDYITKSIIEDRQTAKRWRWFVFNYGLAQRSLPRYVCIHALYAFRILQIDNRWTLPDYCSKCGAQFEQIYQQRKKQFDNRFCSSNTRIGKAYLSKASLYS